MHTLKNERGYRNNSRRGWENKSTRRESRNDYALILKVRSHQTRMKRAIHA